MSPLEVFLEAGYFARPAVFRPIRDYWKLLSCSDWLDKGRLSFKRNHPPFDWGI